MTAINVKMMAFNENMHEKLFKLEVCRIKNIYLHNLKISKNYLAVVSLFWTIFCSEFTRTKNFYI